MNQSDAQLPEAPALNRRFAIYPMQLVGMALIVLIPLLAIFGVLGEVQGSAEANSAAFALTVDYPLRTRHRVFEIITITVENQSDQAYDTVTIRVTEDYIASFAEVAFDVEVERITPDAYEFELTDFQPGESRVVGVELRADQYWQHDGTVEVSAEGAESVSVQVGTFVFP